MPRLINTPSRYGTMTKALHWAVFGLFANQFLVAALMMNAGDDETAMGLARDDLYEWHKSVGVVIFCVVAVRYLWRRLTPLPAWAPNLSGREQRAIHIVERVLYLCMFLMPASGFVFVMAGGYPLNFFRLGNVPNPIGKHEALSLVAEWTHAGTAVVIVLTLIAHWTIVVRHQRAHRDRYLQRMLPFTHQ